ncbi:MAG TPA: hypothetical protein VKY92_04465 [Verrucomicrobiae bacterium]|nr:hypothetical protein [Verrucomicrobiae bacterium]
MNATRTRIVAERTVYPLDSGNRNLMLDQEAVLCGLGMLLAILAMWPISFGEVREYTFLTVAALLVIRSSNWVRVEEDGLTINTGVEVSWPASPGCVLF